MLIRNIVSNNAKTLLSHQSKYFLLDHHKMEKVKQKLFGDQQKTMMLKIKFILKQAKYTLVQGSKDLWSDFKWLKNIHSKKSKKQFTGLQLATRWRIVTDLLKFIPYSVILVVPFAQAFLPIMLWLFPNCIPSFFLFDTAEDKRIQKLQKLQEQSYHILIQKLLDVLRNRFKKQQQFIQYDFFKRDFFEIIDDLNQILNYKNFNSDQLMIVLRFLGGDFITGTSIINKLINLFTLNIPRAIIKTYRYLISKITKKQLAPYKDPFFVKGDFKIFKFNYFPFEYFKKQFLLYQINRKFKMLDQQDQAFQDYGMADIQGYAVRQFARQRGLASLSCYITLKNVVANDWVKITTHPKFTNNTKLWYAVMLYHFMKDTSRDLN